MRAALFTQPACVYRIRWSAARRLLRFKGLFQIAGEPGPLLVQAVAQGMDEPRSLPAWPDQDHDSRMVLIADTTDNNLPDRLLAKIKMLALSNETD